MHYHGNTIYYHFFAYFGSNLKNIISGPFSSLYIYP